MSKTLPVQDWIKQYKVQFKRWEKYCTENDWRYSADISEEYKMQKEICNIILNRLSYFLKKFEAFLDRKYVKNFIETMMVPIELYTLRYNDYVQKNDWNLIKDKKTAALEMSFQSEMMSDFNKIKDKLQELNLDNDVLSLEVPIYGDRKIPLLMKNMVEKEYPKIREYILELNKTKEITLPSEVDLNRVKNSNKLFINIKNPPIYDHTKHYFEQEPYVVEFYENERMKFTKGLTIDGVFIHPWLYWHINFFKTDLPMSVFKDTPLYDETQDLIIANPPLRDNEWLFAEFYKKAEAENTGLFLFGSRRFAKTTLEASLLTWTATRVQNAECTVIGGDDADLKKLAQSLEIALTHMHPAFRLPRTLNDWQKHIQLGLKSKSGNRLTYSNIYVRNVNSGKKTEKTAGASPAAWICDEGGKFALKEMYQAALPSFQTPDGWRVVPVIVGTGGNKELSVDAQEMLSNPEANDILPMDWDLLESFIDNKDLITWERRDFGIFVPGQMSYKEGIKKKQTNLSDFLGMPSKTLSKVKISVTDWQQGLYVMDSDRERKKHDKKALNKEKMYYPKDPLECFLNRIENPFPTREGQDHKDYLLKSGEYGKYVDIFRRAGSTINFAFSDKEPVNGKFEGGLADTPIVMFEDPPDDNSIDGTYVAGLDHYKHDKASTDSLGCLVVFKRNVNLDEWCNKIVLIWAARPKTMEIFNQTCEVILEGYGAECLQENADISFQQHMRRKNKEHIYLPDGDEMARKFINPKATQNNKVGLNPNPKNKQYLLNLVIDYCWEEIEIGKDEEGMPIKVLGITRINDLGLLDEILRFEPNGNFDRITAFGHALAWARYLDSLNVMPKPKISKKANKKRNTRRGFYSSTKFSPYTSKIIY